MLLRDSNFHLPYHQRQIHQLFQFYLSQFSYQVYDQCLNQNYSHYDIIQILNHQHLQHRYHFLLLKQRLQYNQHMKLIDKKKMLKIFKVPSSPPPLIWLISFTPSGVYIISSIFKKVSSNAFG